ENAAVGIAIGEAAEPSREISGEFELVATADIEARRRLARLDVPRGDAGETLADVEGEIRLADLAVIDAVDADFRLLADNIGDDALHLAGKHIGIDRRARGAGIEELGYVLRPRQRAGMRDHD